MDPKSFVASPRAARARAGPKSSNGLPDATPFTQQRRRRRKGEAKSRRRRRDEGRRAEKRENGEKERENERKKIEQKRKKKKAKNDREAAAAAALRGEALSVQNRCEIEDGAGSAGVCRKRGKAWGGQGRRARKRRELDCSARCAPIIAFASCRSPPPQPHALLPATRCRKRKRCRYGAARRAWRAVRPWCRTEPAPTWATRPAVAPMV